MSTTGFRLLRDQRELLCYGDSCAAEIRKWHLAHGGDKNIPDETLLRHIRVAYVLVVHENDKVIYRLRCTWMGLLNDRGDTIDQLVR